VTGRRILSVAALVALSARAAFAQAGITSPSLPVPLQIGSYWTNSATAGDPSALAPTLTIQINSGATQTIASLANNVINTFPTPVSITTRWDLTSIIGTVDVVAYFSSSAAALVNGANRLPSSRMRGRVTTGRPTNFTTFTQNAVNGVGTAGASLHLVRQLVVFPFNTVGQRTDNLDLQLDLRGLPNLAPGTYSGTINIRAIAY
jgi:hypothetical protein